MVVIPNGVDLEVFRPDPEARQRVRDELCIDDRALLIGFFARFHRQKDHETFFRAVALTRRWSSPPHFLLCGEGIERANPRLAQWIDEYGVEDRVHLLGERTDVARLTAALDLATLSSAFAEGLPSAIVEAMACAVPCVATDTGDCAVVIGDTGRVVPKEDPEALANGWRDVLTLGPDELRRLGAVARDRVSQHYDAVKMAQRYADLYREIAT